MMGWFYDRPDLPGCYDHEGYVVALTFRMADRTAALFQELSYPDRATYEPEEIPRIQAGCECGWRSPYIVPTPGSYQGSETVFRLPRWSPCSAWVTESDEERCEALWAEHMRHAVPELHNATQQRANGES